MLNNVSLTLKSGETVALLGRSGCGKSTLARLLVGLESPAQGNICLLYTSDAADEA
ncbi:ATP-binding cassette domain-containing protein, partial [Klebsiella pneumoniae]|nr:ATP-binding cassette domain-containing protein [Klebsiella pneumoniae]